MVAWIAPLEAEESLRHVTEFAVASGTLGPRGQDILNDWLEAAGVARQRPTPLSGAELRMFASRIGVDVVDEPR